MMFLGDKYDRNMKDSGVKPIDQAKARVKDHDDPKEVLLMTLMDTFWRNHLVFGYLNITVIHRKLPRMWRPFVMFVVYAFTHGIVVLLHTVLHFKAATQR